MFPHTKQAMPVGRWGQWSPRVVQVLGLNPGLFTLSGSNTYLVGTGPSRILIDTGEGHPSYVPHLLDVMGRVGCTHISEILLTHWHHDHIGGVKDLLRRLGNIPVRKFKQNAHKMCWRELVPFERGIRLLEGVQWEEIHDGDVFRTEGATIRAIYTPGHTFDHVCFFLEEDDALFSGDNVMGIGTSVFIELNNYMESLKKISDLRPTRIFPGHGPLIWDGIEKIKFYIDHRQQRIDQVKSVLSPTTTKSLSDVFAAVYPHVHDPSLIEGAKGNAEIVLEYLVSNGVATREKDGGWMLASRSKL